MQGRCSPRVGMRPPPFGRNPIAAVVRNRCPRAKSSPTAVTEETTTSREVWPGVFESYWTWNGHRIRYQYSGQEGPAVVLVHGFGGNADHWRRNTPVLGARGHRAFAIDLLGYGYSDKPDPRGAPPNSIYCFETWGRQVADFIEQVVGTPATISTNSVGGLAGLCAAQAAPPGAVLGVQLINISLRGLHVKRQNPLARPFIAGFQQLLRDTPAGAAFFSSVAKRQTVETILTQAYAGAVPEGTVEAILAPGLQEGAPSVFLDFISYSGGPLPEDLLATTTVPVSILWGEKDPWEDINEGRRLFASWPCVEEFVAMPGLGHCPQDQAPEVVNPLIEAFVARRSGGSTNSSSNSSSDGTDTAA